MTTYQHVYLTSTGRFLPGDPVDNERMDAYLGPINAQSARLKRRILRENGIRQRYYAISSDGDTRYSSAHMASQAIDEAITRAGLGKNALDFLACATVGGDLATPGFANQVQGYLNAPPLNTLSVSGICASSVQALRACAHEVELAALGGQSLRAMACASEMPSRMFKTSRFLSGAGRLDFDSQFLRWMLSDGAGAALVQDTAQAMGLGLSPSGEQLTGPGLSLKLKWIHIKSFSGDYPTCMMIGGSEQGGAGRNYLDYPSLSDAEADGAFLLRQDIRLLPNLFDLGVAEFSALVRGGWVKPTNINHFLCHYSSERFAGVVESLLEKSGLAIERNKWYSNLSTRGNTGAASILIMLDEFLQTRCLRAGEQIFCFVPESGRFTVAYMLLEVVNADPAWSNPTSQTIGTSASQALAAAHEVKAPFPDAAINFAPQRPGELSAQLLRELNAVWHEYRSAVFRSSLVIRIFSDRLRRVDYLQWMTQWIPQVREGSLWMRSAVSHLPPEFSAVQQLMSEHANEEQFDFRILYDDYVRAGGLLPLADLKRNPGGEALNAYMYSVAASEASYALLGGIFIIEGTGQRIIPALLPRLKNGLGPGHGAYRFLQYHGENDVRHLERWLSAVEMVLALRPDAAQRIVSTARHVAQLYTMQWEGVELAQEKEDGL